MTPQEAEALRVVLAQLDSVSKLGEHIQRVMHAAVDGENASDLVADLLSRASSHELNSPVGLPVSLKKRDSRDPYNYLMDRTGIDLAIIYGTEFGEWLVTLINGGNDAALDCLRGFTRLIGRSGGVRVDEAGRPLECVSLTDDDLAQYYVKVCELLNEDPVVEPGDPTYPSSPTIHAQAVNRIYRDVTLAVRCARCQELLDNKVRPSVIDDLREDGASFSYVHKCSDDNTAEAVTVELLWQCAWCERWLISTFPAKHDGQIYLYCSAKCQDGHSHVVRVQGLRRAQDEKEPDLK